MPHVLREDARVILFRKWAASEKTLNGNSAGENEYGTLSVGSTLITIQRGRIVEDGYAQLASLSPKALKGTIRVRFQNELGLDEAGIDQDGVFKGMQVCVPNAEVHLLLMTIDNVFLAYF
jgi:ubiquitin-protein ligase E3 B